MARKPAGSATVGTRKQRKLQTPPAARRPAAILAVAKAASAPTPAEWAAIAEGAKQAKDHRGDLAVGKAQPVDITVRIVGLVDVCEDSTANKKTGPAVKELLTAILFLTPEDQRKALSRKLVAHYPKIGGKKLPGGVAETVDNVIALLTTQEEQPKRGAVTGAVTVELVERKRAA